VESVAGEKCSLLAKTVPASDISNSARLYIVRETSYYVAVLKGHDIRGCGKSPASMLIIRKTDRRG
jgi:hypothetical protein